MLRRLTPTLRSFFTHSGHGVALAIVAVMAMAAAPAPFDDLADAEPIVPELVLTAPAPSPTEVPYVEAAKEVTFDTPVHGYAVNSNFGMRRHPVDGKMKAHRGVDIAAPHGVEVKTSAEGEVVRAGYQPTGFGNFVEVRHPNGLTTVYAHLSKVEVAPGQKLAKGQEIGEVGSTGLSTGPHLHFEVRRNGVQMNPMRVLGRTFSGLFNG